MIKKTIFVLAFLCGLSACAAPDDPNPSKTPITASAVSPAVVWSRYVGGSYEDQVRDIAVDNTGNIFIVGGTASDNFPTTVGAWDRTHDNTPNPPTKPYDAFVQKYSPTGQLLASTFVGGSQYDRAYAVSLSPDGTVVIAGRAGIGLPKTAGTVQPVYNGGTGTFTYYGPQDGFVCKLSNDLTQLFWCTYIGAANDGNILRDVTVDPQGVIWVTGGASQPLPAAWTAHGFQPVKAANNDGIVFAISPDGTQILAGTYLGGSGGDGAGPSVRIDPNGEPWVDMTTNSPDMPIVGGAQPTYGGGGTTFGAGDLYLAHLNRTLDTLRYSTYIGGSGNEGTETHTIAIDPLSGDVYVTGGSNSTNLPVVNPIQASLRGTGDALIARYTSQGVLLSLSYLGGSKGDFGQGIALDAMGNVYISSINSGPYLTQPLHGTAGGDDAAALVLTFDLQKVLFGQGLSGSANDQGRAMAVSGGKMYIGGLTFSTNYPFNLGTNPGGTNNGYLTAIRYP